MAEPSLHTPPDLTGGEIQLLVLLPAPRDAPVRCRLETVPLSSAPKYDILTHIWGANKSETITLNDAPFPVSEPIAAALRRLRPPSGPPGSIWIDAVCVDQQGRCGTEQPQQQQQQQHDFLPRIYAEARQLCVWMGEPTAGKGTVVSGFPCLDWDARMPPRLSFVQEAVLARRIVVLCGQHESTWEAMGASLGGNVGEGVRPETVDFLRLYHSIKRLRQEWSAGKRDLSPCGLLYEFRWLECEDPRDRIYSFLDLAPRILEAGVVPDYSTSISTAHIYADFARKMIQHSGTVDILNYVREWRSSPAPTPNLTTTQRAATNDDGDLPSWAPNWASSSAHDPTPLLDWSDNAPSPRYRAAKLLPAQLQPHPDPHTLVLNGIRFDSVAALGTPWHPDPDQPPPASRTEIAALKQWEALALTTPVSCPYGGDGDGDGDGDEGGGGRRAALWRTYIGDFAGARCAPAAHAAVLERWYAPATATATAAAAGNTAEAAASASELQQQRSPFRHLRDYVALRFKRGGGVGVEAGGVVEYARRVRVVCGHRRLLVSKRGYVGLAPWYAEVGDVVAVLHGGSTPFLLRPGAVPGVYSLVGECFVYGIMNGEALSWENAAAAARDFRIV